MIHKLGHQLTPAGDLQLVEDAVDMGFHRAGGDIEHLSDFLIALSLENQAQDLRLPFRQSVVLPEFVNLLRADLLLPLLFLELEFQNSLLEDVLKLLGNMCVSTRTRAQKPEKKVPPLIWMFLRTAAVLAFKIYKKPLLLVGLSSASKEGESSVFLNSKNRSRGERPPNSSCSLRNREMTLDAIVNSRCFEEMSSESWERPLRAWKMREISCRFNPKECPYISKQVDENY